MNLIKNKASASCETGSERETVGLVGLVVWVVVTVRVVKQSDVRSSNIYLAAIYKAPFSQSNASQIPILHGNLKFKS